MNEQHYLNRCLEAFEKLKNENTISAKKKLKKAVDCNLNSLYLAKENYRGRKELFYQSMSEDVRMVRVYLICLSELGLYSFSDDELRLFAY